MSLCLVWSTFKENCPKYELHEIRTTFLNVYSRPILVRKRRDQKKISILTDAERSYILLFPLCTSSHSDRSETVGFVAWAGEDV